MRLKTTLPFFLSLLLVLFSAPSFAQDDLLDLLEGEQEEATDYTYATFKGTRIINGHSVETNSGRVLNFMISHRFGRLNGGTYQLFGLDNATIRLGFEYGVTDRLDIGVGRSSFEKTYDAFAKYKLLRQSSGAKDFPVTMTLFASTALKTLEFPDQDRENLFNSRMYYTFQALIARKFNSDFSLQITPTYVHRNLVLTEEDKNDVLAIGIGGRHKVTGSLSITAEYFYVLPDQLISNVNGEQPRNTFSIGVDLETGGHVFQMHLTNSRGMVEKFFVTESTGDWFDGDIHFGFNVSRVFSLGKPSWEK